MLKFILASVAARAIIELNVKHDVAGDDANRIAKHANAVLVRMPR